MEEHSARAGQASSLSRTGLSLALDRAHLHSVDHSLQVLLLTQKLLIIVGGGGVSGKPLDFAKGYSLTKPQVLAKKQSLGALVISCAVLTCNILRIHQSEGLAKIKSCGCTC